ncbi:MAG: Putative pyruvate, phosphate dikinase regulatory protein [Alphaproteobacteria bacterium]|nr:MAG: Putative pyruvate, phosphate dikinase regulatory protein [Alphaproteobacteria bacterium]
MATTQFHLHLISDSTGETVQAVARAVCAQFVNAEPREHIYGLVRGKKALARALDEMEQNPGPVLYSILDDGLRSELHAACDKMGVPCLSLLQPFVNSLAPYLKVEIANKPGGQHAMDTDYFRRINALNYTIQHDDGQSQGDLNQADIVLTGVSRTSKTPTCIYLANRGYKAANVPLVPGMAPPAELLQAHHPLVVGLTNSPERLQAIRRNRLLTLNEGSETEYIDPELIRGEVAEARRLFARQKWPVIDVTRRSVEEIASAILNLYQEHEKARQNEASI